MWVGSVPDRSTLSCGKETIGSVHPELKKPWQLCYGVSLWDASVWCRLTCLCHFSQGRVMLWISAWCVQPSRGCCLESVLFLAMAAVMLGHRNFTRTVTRIVSLQLKAAASLVENRAGKYSLCCWWLCSQPSIWTGAISNHHKVIKIKNDFFFCLVLYSLIWFPLQSSVVLC